MRVVVTGATGNVGTSLVARLVADPSIDQVVGAARRTGSLPFPGVELVGCDVGSSDLRPVFEGADAVVHLAWAIQQSHDEATLLTSDVSGPFNLAAEPLLDLAVVASLLDAGTFRMPLRALRGVASATWHLRMQPTPPGWLDMAAAVPLMSSHRAVDELGWKPLHTAEATLAELIEGIADSADFPTAPLARETAGRLRRNEWSGTATPPSQRHSRHRLRTNPSGWPSPTRAHIS